MSEKPKPVEPKPLDLNQMYAEMTERYEDGLADNISRLLARRKAKSADPQEVKGDAQAETEAVRLTK
jgi:hypothetical protein